ncbi:MAG: MFS transporter [Clostridia bacterium]|nr:MFS transporter [Clostridia bacterium]
MAKSKPVAPHAAKHPNAISIGEAIGYLFGDMGNLFVLTFVSTYLKVFYTDCLLPGHGVDATRISTDLTVLFLVIRLWDAINDPLWGIIVDTRRPTKNGKFRPYLKTVSVPLGISTALCFLNIQNYISSYAMLLAFAYITYCVYGMLYTGINIPYGSLASAITDDPNGRTLLSTMRSIGAGVGGAAVTLVAQSIIYDDGTKLNPEKTFVAVCVLSALSIAAYMACYKTTRERVIYSPEKKKVNLKLTYGTLFKSRPFLTVTIAGLVISGLLQFGSFNQYLTKNYFGNSNLSIWLTISNYAPMVLLILFCPKLAAKFGKKELATFGSVCSIIAGLGLFIITPDNTTLDLIIYIVCQLFFSLGLGIYSTVSWAMMGDAIDYNEWKFGTREEGTVYSLHSFFRKLAQGLGPALVLLIMVAFGYVGANEGNQLWEVAVNMRYIVAATFLFSAIMQFVGLGLVYNLDKKTLKQMNAELGREE